VVKWLRIKTASGNGVRKLREMWGILLTLSKLMAVRSAMLIIARMEEHPAKNGERIYRMLEL
jgi:hypothetical protein